MNDVYSSFYHPRHEYIDFSTNNLIAKFGFWLLEPGRAVFGRKVVVFNKDNIPSFETIEKLIKHPIVAVALRIILWIPTFLGILFLELARVTFTQFETEMWEVRKACVMDILNHDKWENLKESEITASKIWRLLSYNEMVTLTGELYCEYLTKADELYCESLTKADERDWEYLRNQDERIISKVDFMWYEVVRRTRDRPHAWLYRPNLKRLRFKSMAKSDEATIKCAPLSPFPYVKVLCKLPQHCKQSILKQLLFDNKIVDLLCDDFIDFIPLDSCKPLAKIVSERFANYIINHPSPATVIDKFKESICLSIDLSWIFEEKHDSLLKNLLTYIGDNEKNKKWLFNLARSAFKYKKEFELFSLLSGKQIGFICLFPVCEYKFDLGRNYQIRKDSFNLILKFKEIRSKFTSSDFKKICYQMSNIYRNYPSSYLPYNLPRDEDWKYKVLFSPCGEDRESLRNIPCSLLKGYLDGVKDFYSVELNILLIRKSSRIVFTKEERKNVFQLHPIPPDSDLQKKIQSTELKIQKIIQNQRDEYIKLFHKILYRDELVFLKIYHGILTNEEKTYILELSSKEPEKGSTYLTSSLQIMCMKFLHENPESMEQEKCHQDLLESINAYESLYL